MKCLEFEQWTSDLVDGELPEAKKIILEKHLLGCPSCRAYQKKMETLHEEVLQLDQASAGLEYFQSFSERLGARLASVRPSKRSTVFVNLGWRWTYAAAAVAFVTVMMIFIISPPHRFLQDEGLVVTSYEDAIREIYGSIGEDRELEELFNTLLLTSITQELEVPNRHEDFDYSEKINLLEVLTEEEMMLLKSIKSETQG